MNMLYDSWWYTITRIQQGSFPQWNPYQLFGMIAVQFNMLSVSLFTPIYALFSPTLELYHFAEVIGLFLSYFGLYLLSRLAGFGRVVSLIPCAIYTGNFFFRYYAGWEYQTTFFLMYSIASGLLWQTQRRQEYTLRRCVLIGLLLGVAFVGLRLEFMIYCCTFLVFILILPLLIHFNRRTFWRELAHRSTILALPLLLNGWQLAFLLNATLHNARVTQTKSSLGTLLDPLFLNWFYKAVIYQAPMVTIGIILAVFGLTRVQRRFFFQRSINLRTLITLHLLVGFILAILYKSLPQSFYFETHEPFWMLVCWGVFSFLLHSLIHKLPITGKEALRCLLGTLIGLQLLQYTHYQLWIYDNQEEFHPILEFLIGALLMTGSLRMLSKGHPFRHVLIAGFIYFVFLDPGYFIINDVIGVPWLPLRAQLAAYPLVILLLCTGAKTLLFLSHCHLKKMPVWGRLASRKRMAAAVVTWCFLGSAPLLLPFSNGEFEQNFPYRSTPAQQIWSRLLEGKKESEPYDQRALHRADRLRHLAHNQNPMYRVDPKKHIPEWDFFKPYEILPAVSQVLNTIPLYNSDIPENLAALFSDTYRPQISMHPELTLFNRLYPMYKTELAIQKGQPVLRDYENHVVVHFQNTNQSLDQNLLASEHSRTQRAYITTNVLTFSNQSEERTFLKDWVEKRLKPLDGIVTTSDPLFHHQSPSDPTANGTIRFIHDKPEEVMVEANSSHPGYLVLLDLHSSGWKAEVNQVAQTIFRGNIGTRFVPIPAGRSTVRFTYQVPFLGLATLISLTTWVSATFLLLRRKEIH